MKILDQLRKPNAGASVESEPESVLSKNITNPGLRFVDEPLRSSEAVSELSKLFDNAVDKLENEGDLGDKLQLQLKKLYDGAATYPNSKLDMENAPPPQEWNCSRHEAEIISAACTCSVAVYDLDSDISVPGFAFSRKASIKPRVGGAAKAVEIFIVEKSVDGVSGSNPLLPMLVVAVKGPASRIERLLEVKGDSKESKRLNSNNPYSHVQHLYAHTGFLNSAENVMPLLTSHIHDLVPKHGVQHLLFTGHSAGGAVSSLLFAKYFFSATLELPALKFSSITFGAPPVTGPELDILTGSSSLFSRNRGLIISVVNEYDILTRIDGPYIHSLVNLYRSIYGLPRVRDDRPLAGSGILAEQPPQPKFERTGAIDKAKKMPWHLPKPTHGHVGQIIVLKTGLKDYAESDDRDDDDDFVLKLLIVDKEKFSGLLWSHVAVHKRVCYKERVDLLLDGCFNGKRKW